MKALIVRALNTACTAVDQVAYRPAVIRLTRPLPRWWNCELAHLSMRLDDRWGTGFWSSQHAPPAPGALCEACRRRSAWLVVGGPLEPEVGEEDDPERSADPYLATHEVELCSWCRLDADAPIRTAADLARALRGAGDASVGWFWRWRPSRLGSPGP